MSRIPFSTLDRKTAMLRAGVTGAEAARACGADQGTVSRVVSGRYTSGRKVRCIMQYIADRVGVPVEIMFPGFSEAA